MHADIRYGKAVNCLGGARGRFLWVERINEPLLTLYLVDIIEYANAEIIDIMFNSNGFSK